MIFVGSDHAGFKLKLKVIAFLERRKVRFKDLGPYVFNPDDDYPDYCFPVAEAVSKLPGSFGVVIGGSGVGEAIAANKVKGVRAAQVYDSFSARKSREHNDANVISLRARGVSIAKNLQLLSLWLRTTFSGEARHERRIAKLKSYEGGS